MAHLRHRAAHYLRQLRRAIDQRIGDQPYVHHHESDEDRQQGQHRLLHAAQIHPDQQQYDQNAGPELELQQGARKKAEDGVSAARDRNRNGQHVIDHQRASGNQSRITTEQLRGNQISAAAGGELVDRLGIGRRDNKNRQRHQHRKKDCEILMLSQGQEGFLGTIA